MLSSSAPPKSTAQAYFQKAAEFPSRTGAIGLARTKTATIGAEIASNATKCLFEVVFVRSPSFYCATGGPFVETGLLTESEGRKSIIIKKTSSQHTTASPFIEM